MYTHILAAIDLSDESPQVIRRLRMMADARDGDAVATTVKVTLMHVVEPVGFAYGGDIPLDLTEVTDNLITRAEQRLRELETHLQGVPVDSRVVVGRPATELHAFAESENVDLIIVGSHGRSGWKLLLGSTANSVLHGAHCDVLAVRVRSESDD